MLSGLKRDIDQVNIILMEMAEVQPHKIRKTNSISPEKICLPDWKDLKGNKSMTLHQLAPRRLSIIVDDDVALSQYNNQPYTPLGQLQSDFHHMLPMVRNSPMQKQPQENTFETGSQQLQSYNLDSYPAVNIKTQPNIASQIIFKCPINQQRITDQKERQQTLFNAQYQKQYYVNKIKQKLTDKHQEKLNKQKFEKIIYLQNGQGCNNIWTEQEDLALTKLVEDYGSEWKQIAKYLTQRSNDDCRLRWQNVLNPDIKKGQWTIDEDNLLAEQIMEHGTSKWSEIAKYLPGRTNKQCRRRWILKKSKIKDQGSESIHSFNF